MWLLSPGTSLPPFIYDPILTLTHTHTHTLSLSLSPYSAMDIALGEIYTGVFTNSTSLWTDLSSASAREHDLLWRMPLSEEYAFQIRGSNADLCNVGGRPAGACTAALFLKSFVPGLEGEEGEEGEGEEGGEKKEEKGKGNVRWAHVDMAGTMEASRKGAYQESGMTGRPTR